MFWGDCVKGFSEHVSLILAENNIIKKDELELCKYGLEVLTSTVFDIVSVMIVSFFAGNFVDTLVFLISFFTLRIYAGGYHADTKLKCYLIFVAVYILFTLTGRYVPEQYYVVTETIISFVTFTVILIFAPVVNYKRSANSKERSLYKKVSIAIFTLQIFILLITAKFNRRYAFDFSLGQLAVSLSMIAAFVKSKIKEVIS